MDLGCYKKQLLYIMLHKMSSLKSNKIRAQESFQIIRVSEQAYYFFILFLIIWFNSSCVKNVCFENGGEQSAEMVPQGVKGHSGGLQPEAEDRGFSQFRSVSSAFWGQKFIFPMCLGVCSNVYCLSTVKCITIF